MYAMPVLLLSHREIENAPLLQQADSTSSSEASLLGIRPFTSPPYTVICGEDALSEFETMAKQKSDEKSEKKKERAFDIFLALLGAIIGLLIEHFSGIVDWFISLF